MTTLVIGGSGMLGSAIVRQLNGAGADVRVFDRIAYPDPRIETRISDVLDAVALESAIAGVETVIHTVAAVSQTTRPIPMMYAINVGATESVIAACQRQGVGRLIYTSSIDVVFDGTDITDGDESLPYPAHHLDYYGTTKMLAERAVIAANGVSGLATCSLRVGALYGENDHNRFPVVLQPVFDTGIYTRLGDGTAKHGFAFVDNCAYAHLLAAQQLTLDSAIAGECYFINDHPPVNFFDFFLPYLDALAVAYQVRSTPYGVVKALARVTEFMANRRPIPADSIPASGGLSRYAVEATCRDFWFNHRKATRDLGYAPLFDQSVAFDRTLAWLRTWIAARAENS
ncbi:MAG: NAD-dependent epimerase/dehydratase family protein [Chloroflexota bacterium]|nr:NAD-dependent epimerase/dehydratase family protein [Chloroflexota bacterium]